MIEKEQIVLLLRTKAIYASKMNDYYKEIVAEKYTEDINSARCKGAYWHGKYTLCMEMLVTMGEA